VRDKKVASLTLQADIEMVMGYVLFLSGDVLNIIRGDATERVGALIDLVSTVLNSVIPLLGHIFGAGTSLYQRSLQFASWAIKGLGVMQGWLGVLNSANWWLKNAAEVAINLLMASVSGPAGIFVQGLIMAVKPMIGNLLDVGGHFLQSLAFRDYAEAERENQMPIQDWCTQFKGC